MPGGLRPPGRASGGKSALTSMRIMEREKATELSVEQKKEMHMAILGYLQSSQYEKTFLSLSSALGELRPEPVHAKMLEVKWRSIVKLQKKVMQLEAQGKTLEDDIKNFGKQKGPGENADALPRSPAKLSMVGHTEVITCVRFHPKYQLLASASEDASIRVWDAESGRLEKSMSGHQDAVQHLDFNRKGTMIVSCSADMTIKMWETQEYNCVKTLTGHEHNVSSVIFSPSGRLLYSCSRDKSVRVWDAATGVCKGVLKGHTEWVRCLASSSGSALIASGAMDKTVRLWDPTKETAVHTLEGHEHSVECLVFSSAEMDKIVIENLLGPADKTAAAKRKLAWKKAHPDDKDPGGFYLVSGSRDRSLRVWCVATCKCILVLERAHDNWVRDITIHPSGKFLLSCSDDNSIRVWNLVNKGKLEKKIDAAHDLFVSSLHFCPSMPWVATGGVDKGKAKPVKLWECV